MTLIHIAVFILLAVIARLLKNTSAAKWVMLLASVIFVFWLQPVSTIRSLEFWLPVIFLGSVVTVWGIVSPKESILRKENWMTGLMIALVILTISLLRYAGLQTLSKFVNPPQTWMVVIYLVIAGGLVYLYQKQGKTNKVPVAVAILSLLLIFVLLKYQPLTRTVSVIWRKINGQSINLAQAGEVAWVGYSYFAFRLIHVLREWQQGRKIDANLQEFVIYAAYFPAFTAGPIDRLDHFQKELQNRDSRPIEEDWLEGGKRITRGLFLKFILADSVAIIALNSSSAAQVIHTGWMWVMVYAYALRLYFDFSGYSDIAIGISRIMGIQLPENFNKPYLSENVTVFWNRWHITLTQWFRTYYFNPVTRYLRSQKKPIPAGLIIFFTQITTMLLIALWHGISLNFVIWGLWNGLGMFVHNRWAEWKKSHPHQSNNSPNSFKAAFKHWGSVFLTFNFIALGWIWFAIPDIGTSLAVFSRLLGGI